MPIYGYKCGACGHSEDFMQKIGDAPLTVCVRCGAHQFTKQLSAAGFQLKGSGWYATDFKSGTRPSGEVKPADAASSAPGTGGSDSATPCGGHCACH